MTSSDAPAPPGGPLRQDAAEGGFADDAERSGSTQTAGADGSDRERSRTAPAAGEESVQVHGDRPEQSADAAEQQEENAETSLDQPST